MKATFLPTAMVATALLIPSVLQAQDRNVVTRIEVAPEQGHTSVRIVGSQARPSFTQFSLANPTRVVIDLANAQFQGLPEEIPGRGPLVRRVRTATFASQDMSVARVTVELAEEAGYDVSVEGAELILTFEGAGAPPAFAANREPEAAQASDDAAVARLEEAEAAREAARAREAEATRNAAAARQRRAEAEADLAQEAELAEAEAARETARAEAALAELETLRTRGEAGEAVADSLSDSSEAQAEEAAAALDAAERRLAEAEAARRQAREAELARAREAELAQAREAELARTREAEMARTREAEMARTREAEMAEARAAARARSAREAPSREGDVEVLAGPRVMERVGFRQMGDVSRVFIRTNEPVRYHVDRDGRTVIVELERTHAATRNDLNHLDTRFFDTPIEWIKAVEDEAPADRVRVGIRLREAVPFEVTRDDGEIHIDFKRPAR